MHEAGFFLVADDTAEGGIQIIPHPDSQSPDSITVELPTEEVLMEFHVHGDGFDSRPSREDQRIADEHYFDVYTGSSQGLFVYRYKTRQIEFLAKDLDWLK